MKFIVGWVLLIFPLEHALASDGPANVDTELIDVYSTRRAPCGDAKSSLIVEFKDGAVTVHAGASSNGTINVARNDEMLFFTLGQTECRYGLVLSGSDRPGPQDLRTALQATELLPLSGALLRQRYTEPSSACKRINVTLSFQRGSVILAIAWWPRADGKEEQSDDRAVLSPELIRFDVGRPPCALGFTALRLD